MARWPGKENMTDTNEMKITDSDRTFLRSISEQIIEHFDFNNVHDYMVTENWKWTMVENDQVIEKIPTIEELKTQVRELFDAVIASDDIRHHVSTGGFKVEKNMKLLPGKKLKLKFQFSKRVKIGGNDFIIKAEFRSKKQSKAVKKADNIWLN